MRKFEKIRKKGSVSKKSALILISKLGLGFSSQYRNLVLVSHYYLDCSISLPCSCLFLASFPLITWSSIPFPFSAFAITFFEAIWDIWVILALACFFLKKITIIRSCFKDCNSKLHLLL